MSSANVKTSRAVTLSNIVYNVLNDLEEYSEKNFKRYMQWAIRGMTQLNIHMLPSVELDYLTVTSNNTIELPDDFIRLIKLFIIYNDREWSITKDCNIPITRDEDDGSIVQYDGLKDAISVPSAVTWLDAPAKAFNVSYVRYDSENNRLILDGDLAGETLGVIYKSTGVSLSGETFIPVEARESLVAWVHLQRSKFNPKNAGSYSIAKNELDGALYDLNNFLSKDFSYDDFLDAVRSGHSQLTKR